MAKKTMVASEWKKRNVEISIKPGTKPGWWQVQINGKKFIMKEVSNFYGEQTERKEPF